MERDPEPEPTDVSLVVRVEALPNAKGFIPMGEGRLVQEESGFTPSVAEQSCFLTIVQGSPFRRSIIAGTEGPCIVLSDKDCCYYIYSDDLRIPAHEDTVWGEYYYRMRKQG